VKKIERWSYIAYTLCIKKSVYINVTAKAITFADSRNWRLNGKLKRFNDGQK